MRTLGTVLLVVGVFLVVAAVLASTGTPLEMAGLDLTVWVTSIPGTLAAGVLMAAIGLVLRKSPR